MTCKQFLIFTFVVMTITAHFVQWCWYRDLKKNVSIINQALIMTAGVLDNHLATELNSGKRIQ